MYTGSGGKDLRTKNQRTGKQTFNQELTKANLALAATCDAPVIIPSCTDLISVTRLSELDAILIHIRSPSTATLRRTGEIQKEYVSSEVIS
jgi:hypothetical protein